MTELTEQQRQALAEKSGFVRGSSFVLMSVDVFRQVLGFDDEAADRSDTLAAVDEAMADFAAGRSTPAADVFSALDRDHGLHD